MAEYEVTGLVWAPTRTYLVEAAERIVELYGLDASAEPWRKTVYEVWKHIKDGNAYFVTRPDTKEPVYLVPSEARPRYVRTPPDETGRDNLVALGEPHAQLIRMLSEVLSAKSLASICNDLDLLSDGNKQAKAERIVELVGTFEVLVQKLDEALLRQMCNAYVAGFSGSRAEMIEFLRRYVTGQEIGAVRHPPGVEPATPPPEEKPEVIAPRFESAPAETSAPAEAEPRKARVAISAADFNLRLAAMFERWRRLPPGQRWAPLPELPLAGWWELSTNSTRAFLPVFDSDVEASRSLIGSLCEWLGGGRTEKLPDTANLFEWVPATVVSQFLTVFNRVRAVPLFHSAGLSQISQVLEMLEQAAAAGDRATWADCFDLAMRAEQAKSLPENLPPLRELQTELRLRAPLPTARRELAELVRAAYFSARFRDVAQMLEAAEFEE